MSPAAMEMSEIRNLEDRPEETREGQDLGIPPLPRFGWGKELSLRLETWIDRLSTRHMTETPEGRAVILAQLAEAEGQNGGEIRLFDHLLAAVDDPLLNKVVRRHREDEERHEALFKDCVRRTGVDPGSIPAEMQVLLVLDRKIGVLSQPVRTPEQIMKAYLLLLVIEERALTQFQMLEEVFRLTDPYAADRIREIARDEARHVKYCHAVSRKYAPSEEGRLRELRRLRELEVEAFAEVEMANLRLALRERHFTSRWKRLFWRAMGALGKLQKRRPYTAFHYQDLALQRSVLSPSLS